MKNIKLSALSFCLMMSMSLCSMGNSAGDSESQSSVNRQTSEKPKRPVYESESVSVRSDMSLANMRQAFSDAGECRSRNEAKRLKYEREYVVYGDRNGLLFGDDLRDYLSIKYPDPSVLLAPDDLTSAVPQEPVYEDVDPVIQEATKLGQRIDQNNIDDPNERVRCGNLWLAAAKILERNDEKKRRYEAECRAHEQYYTAVHAFYIAYQEYTSRFKHECFCELCERNISIYTQRQHVFRGFILSSDDKGNSGYEEKCTRWLDHGYLRFGANDCAVKADRDGSPRYGDDGVFEAQSEKFDRWLSGGDCRITELEE